MPPKPNCQCAPCINRRNSCIRHYYKEKNLPIPAFALVKHKQNIRPCPCPHCKRAAKRRRDRLNPAISEAELDRRCLESLQREGYR